MTHKTAINFAHPTAIFEFLPAGKPRDKYLTKEQCQSLILASKNTPHLHLFVLIALSTGARRNAILELTWEAVSLERGIIDFSYNTPSERCKTRSVVPISGQLISVLTAAHRRAKTGNVIEFQGKLVKSISVQPHGTPACRGDGNNFTATVLWVAFPDFPAKLS